MSTVSPQGYNIVNDPINENPFWRYEVEGEDIKEIVCVKTVEGDFDFYAWSYIDLDDISHPIVTQKVSNKAGTDGTTYTPYYDASGNLCWTNDGGKPVPAPFHIVGAKGDKGDTGATGATGPTGPQGIQGIPGPQGIAGPAGANGIDGQSPVVTIADITGGKRITFTVGTDSTSVDIMNGEDGTDGASATIAVGTTTTGQPGSSASVTNSGTASAAVLDFTIPAGVKGDKGDKGENGSDGADGVSPEVSVQQIVGGTAVTITDAEHPTGQTFNVMNGQDGMGTIGVGTTTTGEPGTQASVTNSGSIQNAILNFTIPAGANGAKGDKGDPGLGTITIGTTTTGQPGTDAAVTNSGTIQDAILNFTIPAGEKGEKGDKGDKGDTGLGTVTVGTTTTGEPGTNASVTNSGTSQDAVLNFTIPRGNTGAAGADGADGVSPAVTVGTISGGHSVTITDKDHPSGQTFNVMDGTNGQGVPTGGTAGQVLTKNSSTNYDASWATPSGGGVRPFSSRIVNCQRISTAESNIIQYKFPVSSDKVSKICGFVVGEESLRVNYKYYSGSSWNTNNGYAKVYGFVPIVTVYDELFQSYMLYGNAGIVVKIGGLNAYLNGFFNVSGISYEDGYVTVQLYGIGCSGVDNNGNAWCKVDGNYLTAYNTGTTSVYGNCYLILSE